MRIWNQCVEGVEELQYVFTDQCECFVGFTKNLEEVECKLSLHRNNQWMTNSSILSDDTLF